MLDLADSVHRVGRGSPQEMALLVRQNKSNKPKQLKIASGGQVEQGRVVTTTSFGVERPGRERVERE